MRFLLVSAKVNGQNPIRNLLTSAFPVCQIIETNHFDKCDAGVTGCEIAILDQEPSLGDGPSLLADFDQKFPGLPMIMVMDECGVDLAVSLMKAGLTDLIFTRDVDNKLVPAINQALLRKVDSDRNQRGGPVEYAAKVIGSIAHDFNNILAPMRLALDMLPRLKDPKQVNQVTSTMRVSVERGSTMIRQIQAFVHGEESDCGPLVIRGEVLQGLAITSDCRGNPEESGQR